MITDPILQQTALFFALLATLGLFIINIFRYDIVALLALLTVTLIGIVPASEAFLGFGHPAVVTVALVLIMSRALQNAGIVAFIGQALLCVGKNPVIQVFVLTLLITCISGFMNNIGALAILMPVAIHIAREAGTSPSILLMPLAFGSLLGGMTTMIGTPPNIIIAAYRQDALGESFALFDFMPVGVAIAVAGVLFLSLIGWRLLPIRRKHASSEELFEISSYVTELRVISKGQFVGIRVDELEKQVEGDLILLGVVRRGQIMSAYPTLELKGNDIIIIEADSGVLEDLTTTHGFKLVTDALLKKEVLGDEEVIMMEAVVTPQSSIVQRRPGKLQMRKRFGVNLLAVARQGRRLKRRLNNIQLSVGDVLLLRGTKPSLQTAVSATGCLPLAERSLRVGQKRRLLAAVSVFVGALATVVSGLFPIQIAFCLAIVIMTIMGLVSLRELYTAIDWPIIVLLGAMIPVGQALETTGAAALIAQQLLVVASIASPSVVLGIILVGTMFLSDLVNNAAAAILMAPIALGVADSLDVSVDPFLMAVAIGASCAFLTPIGHQSSALVMGPGGYHFGDYWKVGLPLEILIAAIGIPALLYFWPL